MKKHISPMMVLLLAICMLCPVPEAYAEGTSLHYIAVASDRHNTPSAIGIAMTGMPSSVEYVCLDGDMTDADHGGRSSEGHKGGQTQMAYNTSELVSEVNAVFPNLTAAQMSVVYGSHDANATDDAGIMKCISAYADEATKKITESGADSSEVSAGQSGQIYEGPDGKDADSLPDYYIYGVSFYDMQKAEPAVVYDETGTEMTIEGSGGEAAAGTFKSWIDSLNQSDPDVPVIVIGHVPMHYKRGDNFGATYWSDALNYAATGSVDGTAIKRDVVYLHGHNHTVESTEYFVEPGDELALQGPSSDDGEVTASIRYTYITAGYLRDNHTSTLIKVNGNDLSFTKFKGCILSFDSAGGSDTDSQTVRQGTKASKPADPVRKGWVFTGWYTESACENAYDFSSPVTDDMTLYAGWVRGSKPAAPTLSAKIIASKKRVKLSWNANAAASDFRVAYRKAGASGWTRKWANGKTSYTVRSLEKKGLYDFRVNAVYESGDRMIYSDDSRVVRRYISSLSKVRAKAKKKGLKLSWKKDSKATGYIIKYSADRNMQNAVKVKVGGGKRSKVIRNLKRNKTYYVRIRPYVSSAGKIYYGKWSSRKSVKTN